MNTLTNSEKFKLAHKITRETVKTGDDYRATFSIVLFDLNNPVETVITRKPFVARFAAMVAIVILSVITSSVATATLPLDMFQCKDAWCGAEYGEIQYLHLLDDQYKCYTNGMIPAADGVEGCN